MAVDTLLIKVAEWSVQLMTAAETKSQQQHANVLGHAAFLDAGLRFLDRRFVELFLPLTMYERGAWPLDRRREHADQILSFISSPDVIPRLAASIQWLETSPVSDRHVWELTHALCQTVRDAVWTDEITEVTEGPLLSTKELYGETWIERARTGGPPGDLRLISGVYPSHRRIDSDNYALPVVKKLIEVLRQDDPDQLVVSQLAGTALTRPAVFAASPWASSFGSSPHDEGLGQPTISPLRDWADIADMQFASLLAVVQQSFPGVPAPEWMWQI